MPVSEAVPKTEDAQTNSSRVEQDNVGIELQLGPEGDLLIEAIATRWKMSRDTVNNRKTCAYFARHDAMRPIGSFESIWVLGRSILLPGLR